MCVAVAAARVIETLSDNTDIERFCGSVTLGRHPGEVRLRGCGKAGREEEKREEDVQ